MDASFIQKIYDISQPAMFEINGRTYSSRPLSPVYDPSVETIEVHTLSGVAEFIRRYQDNYRLWIKDYDAVELLGTLQSDSQRYPHFVSAQATSAKQLHDLRDLKTFIIVMQTAFIQDEVTAAIIRVVGNVLDGKTTVIKDDGITQQVSVRTGISLAERADIPNPVVLRPYRTFREIEQPASLFVMRIRQGGNGSQPVCALFQADGDAWQLDAIESIRNYFAQLFPDLVILG